MDSLCKGSRVGPPERQKGEEIKWVISMARGQSAALCYRAQTDLSGLLPSILVLTDTTGLFTLLLLHIMRAQSYSRAESPLSFSSSLPWG